MDFVSNHHISVFLKSCGHKARLSQEKAEELVDKAFSQKILLYYYKCGLCKSRHLTSSPPDEEAGEKVLRYFQNYSKKEREMILEFLSKYDRYNVRRNRISLYA
jgi:hypothetical protein